MNKDALLREALDMLNALGSPQVYEYRKVDDLLSRITAALEDKSGGWISVSERLPDIDLPVWCWDGTNIWWGCRVDDSDGWLWARSYAEPQYYAGSWTCDDAETDDDYQPTHWKELPLPPLPKGE